MVVKYWNKYWKFQQPGKTNQILPKVLQSEFVVNSFYCAWLIMQFVNTIKLLYQIANINRKIVSYLCKIIWINKALRYAEKLLYDFNDIIRKN